MSIYNFKLKNTSGEVVDFSSFKGKTILIVNVASKCGFAGQYKGLEKLHQDYKNDGLVILGFPCTQFKNQEFETDQETKDFCTLKYDVTFEIFSRIDVKGENQAPLYKFLTESLPWNSKKLDVKWNFEKFLINKEGSIVKRYPSITTPKKIEKDIVQIL